MILFILLNLVTFSAFSQDSSMSSFINNFDAEFLDPTSEVMKWSCGEEPEHLMPEDCDSYKHCKATTSDQYLCFNGHAIKNDNLGKEHGANQLMYGYLCGAMPPTKTAKEFGIVQSKSLWEDFPVKDRTLTFGACPEELYGELIESYNVLCKCDKVPPRVDGGIYAYKCMNK